MAHGKCVIVSAIPENLEVVGDGSLTFNAGDVNDLARVISELDSDPEATRRLGALAVDRVKQAYDWRKIVDSLEHVYLGE